MQQLPAKCPICGDKSAAVDIRELEARIDCKCCGNFSLHNDAKHCVLEWELDGRESIKISYYVRRIADRDKHPIFDLAAMNGLRNAPPIPYPDELLDEFVIWLGTHLHPGQSVGILYPDFRAVLGAVDEESFNYMLKTIGDSDWFNGKPHPVHYGAWPFSRCSLTPKGWGRYRDLITTKLASRFGFMAMKYGDSELDKIVRDYFRPALKQADFDLRVLNEGQPAGIIDDQIRVAIRTARFLICDLSHGNRGAYWEAGFAEGLGKPVIYTCRRDVFDNSDHADHPHFDTGHLVTVPWDPTSPTRAAERLKATIRATLPTEAKLED